MKNGNEKDYKKLGFLIVIAMYLILEVTVDIILGDKRSAYKIIIDIFSFKNKLHYAVLCLYISIIVYVYIFVIRPFVENKFPEAFKLLVRIEIFCKTHLIPTKTDRSFKITWGKNRKTFSEWYLEKRGVKEEINNIEPSVSDNPAICTKCSYDNSVEMRENANWNKCRRCGSALRLVK